MFDADSVRQNRMTKSATNAEVESVIKDWLRTASDRSGGRRQREAANRPSVVALDDDSDDEAAGTVAVDQSQ